MVNLYINANTGVDEINAGTKKNPFRTIDYCVTQLETKASNDDVTIYLDNGEYDFTNRNLFNYTSSKSITIIGNGKNTIFYNHFHGGNSNFGTVGLNIYFKRFVWDNSKNQDSTSNVFIFEGKFYFENVLFLNIPDNDYGFFLPRQGLHMKNCVKPKNSRNFYRNDIQESSLIGFYGYCSWGYGSTTSTINPFENNVLLTSGEAQLDEDYRIIDNSVDANLVGLYAGEYSWKDIKCLIKYDNKYYSINEEYYNETTQIFNEVGSLDFEKGFLLKNLTKEVTYGNDTFIPLDKFNNFQIVFKDTSVKKIEISAYKIEDKIVETNFIDLKMVDTFNQFEINGENSKCLIKINEENNIYKYDFDNKELIIENINNIVNNGININEIQNIDFNKIKEEKGLNSISFIFYLVKDSIINNISFTYLGIGEYLQKAGNEINLKNGYKQISFKPNFNTDILKVNAIWGNGEIENNENNCLLNVPNDELKTDNKTVIGAINELKESIPINSNGAVNLEQKVLLNVESNKKYSIPVKNSNNKVITQAFKFLQGEQDVVQTVKSFQNSENDNFYYDKNNTKFDDNGCSIKNSFDLEITNNNGLFESPIIKKDEFLELNFESIGVGFIDISPRMTSNTTPAPYKIYANSEYGGSWQAWNAFDGIADKTSDTGWVSSYTNLNIIPYITIDFGKTINFCEIWLGCYRYNSNHATRATIEYSLDNSKFTSLGTYSLNYTNDIYEKINSNNRLTARFIRITINNRYNSKIYTGFSEIKIFDNKTPIFLIKKDDIYYTIENNLLKQIGTEINEEIIINNGIEELAVINENINILPDNFSVISNEEFQLTIKGLKENKQLVIASDDFSSTIQENIDYFECRALQNGNGQIKISFSLDSGNSWKSYKDGNFIDLDCNIPLKEFDLLTDEELELFNTAKQKIYENGINFNELKNIDFNVLNFEKIRFAYVLSVENSKDVAINKELIWQFDCKGSLKQLKDSEFDLELKENIIEFKPLINSDMIKINIFRS